jgi:hypothetical protein
MTQFKAISATAEVNGDAVHAIVDGVGAMKQMALDLLRKNGIVDPQPGKWYPQQAWLSAFKEISEKIGPNTVFQIATKIPDNAKFPPQIDSVEKALAAIDVAYHMNHRGGDIGSYKFVSTGPHAGKVVCANPMPCAFDRGLISSMVKRFKSASAATTVNHDDSQPCRSNGQPSCTFLVTW